MPMPWISTLYPGAYAPDICPVSWGIRPGILTRNPSLALHASTLGVEQIRDAFSLMVLIRTCRWSIGGLSIDSLLPRVFGDPRFTGLRTELRRKLELGTTHMVHSMANVTRDKWLGTTCILLNSTITTVMLHFFFHPHFLFHFFFGLLFKRNTGKRRWNAKS